MDDWIAPSISAWGLRVHPFSLGSLPIERETQTNSLKSEILGPDIFATIISLLFPYDFRLISLYYFPILSHYFPLFLYLFRYYFAIISLYYYFSIISFIFRIISVYALLPDYFPSISLLLLHYFPIISTLFPYYFHIISLLFPDYFLIVFLLFPHYFLLMSLFRRLFRYCFPIVYLIFLKTLLLGEVLPWPGRTAFRPLPCYV